MVRLQDAMHNNKSNLSHLSVMPVEYLIYDYTKHDYNKVNPVQVLHEGKLHIISTYAVENKCKTQLFERTKETD